MKKAALGENPLLSSRDPGTPIGLKVSVMELKLTLYSWRDLELGSHLLCQCLPTGQRY